MEPATGERCGKVLSLLCNEGGGHLLAHLPGQMSPFQRHANKLGLGLHTYRLECRARAVRKVAYDPFLRS